MSPGPPDLSGVREVRAADVWKGPRLAARLRREGADVVFAYTQEYLADPGPAVATTLPVDPHPVRTGAGAVPAFFAGLLPEGRRLSSLRRAVKTSADDELSLLLAAGADPVGDVRVLPSGAPPGRRAALVEVARWEDVVFADVLADAGVRDPAALPGVQDKASARMLSVPLAHAGRRFILKVDPPELPHVVANEAFFLRLARAAGLPVAASRVVHDRTGRPGLLVERFDRRPDPATGEPTALPVEDAAQVMGLYPAAKYTPSGEEVATALADLCPARAVALRDAYRQVVFAWLTGNGDLHAKNMSVLSTGPSTGLPTGPSGGEWRISPAYDLPCTLFYGDRTLALGVQGRRDGLSRRLLLAFADAVGLPSAAAARTLDRILQATAGLTAQALAGLPFPPGQVRDAARVLGRRHRDASPR